MSGGKDILEEIIAAKRQEVAGAKRAMPLRELMRRCEQYMATGEGSVVASLRGSIEEHGGKGAVIAEFKRKSPSKGWIHRDSTVEEVASGYQRAGAAGISILTDEPFFGGKPEFVRRAREAGVSLPILYKNFIIDEYQLLEARLCGASAALLIASALREEEYRRMLGTARELALEVLLEVHDESEIEYAAELPDLIGVNNRCLGTFTTTLARSKELSGQLPAGIPHVSESGIATAADARALREAGYDAFLIGESFMREAEPAAALRKFLEQL